MERSTVTLDEVRKLDLRIGEVVTAEPIAGADRLLRVEVDIGTERRWLVAGVARHYAPADLVGQSVVLVANMQAAVIRGVTSQGMLLGANCHTGGVALLTVDRAVPNGTPVE